MHIGKKGCQKNLTTASVNPFAGMREMPYFKATHYKPFRHTTFSPFCISLVPHNSNLFRVGESKRILLTRYRLALHQHSFFNPVIHVPGIVRRIHCFLRRLQSISGFEIAEGPKNNYFSPFTHTCTNERGFPEWRNWLHIQIKQKEGV